MSIAEGVNRLTRVGRWMVFIALIGSGLFAGLTLALALLPVGQYFHGIGLLEFVPLFFPIAVMGAILWFAGWIVEGFAKKDQ
jgi:hypothetical protein